MKFTQCELFSILNSVNILRELEYEKYIEIWSQQASRNVFWDLGCRKYFFSEIIIRILQKKITYKTIDA